jgi:ornithine cyclodeaminase/alanine dehydrogenase
VAGRVRDQHLPAEARLAEEISDGREKTLSPAFVSAAATERVLAWPDIVARLRQAYAEPHGPAVSPPRTLARGNGNWLRTLTAVPPGARFMGAKIFGLGRRPSVEYVIALFEQETGRIAGFVDAHYVTAYRTGATSAVAVDRLAPPDAAAIGMLGSGLEARSHLRALAAVRPIESVKVFSPTAANRDGFAAAFEKELGVRCTPVASAEAAVAESTIVVAAARSRDESPILLGKWLRRGMLTVSIGSTIPEQREIDPAVVDACDLIVCDNVEEVVHETGDMIAAKKAGIRFDHKLASLNDLAAGRIDDKVAAAHLPMFKSVGAAIQDVIVAELAFEKAVAQGLATALPIEFLTKGSSSTRR